MPLVGVQAFQAIHCGASHGAFFRSWGGWNLKLGSTTPPNCLAFVIDSGELVSPLEISISNTLTILLKKKKKKNYFCSLCWPPPPFHLKGKNCTILLWKILVLPPSRFVYSIWGIQFIKRTQSLHFENSNFHKCPSSQIALVT